MENQLPRMLGVGKRAAMRRKVTRDDSPRGMVSRRGGDDVVIDCDQGRGGVARYVILDKRLWHWHIRLLPGRVALVRNSLRFSWSSSDVSSQAIAR
jgi:hypothetical protein